MKHFIGIGEFSKEELTGLIGQAMDIKKNPAGYADALRGKYIALFFEKPSLRTKASFFIGTLQLGGQAIYFSPDEIQLGKREKIADVARATSQFVDAAVLRTFSHNNVLEFQKFSTIPVINALSDFSHPSQILGDLITMSTHFGALKGRKVAYIGDGNNVCNSLIYAFAILGGSLSVATPKKYGPKPAVLRDARELSKRSGASITFDSLQNAASGADVLYTDVWASMGQEKEAAIRRKAFKQFQINDKLMKLAKPDCLVMHCLPAHRGEEISESAIESSNSVVFEQAQDRLHAAKAILRYVFS